MTMLQVPVHPGEILKHEFLDPMAISAGKLAKHIHVPGPGSSVWSRKRRR